jgi:hypothetical protein
MSLVIIKTEQHYSDQWIAYDDATYDGPGSALGVGRSGAFSLCRQSSARGR